MRTLLHRSLGSLVLLACLGFGAPALATTNAPAADRQVQAQAAMPAQIAWQRVGSPLSLNA